MLSIFAFLLVLGFLIFVHELGHFIAARSVGIRVEVFSLGFGPRLFGFRRGETDYQVSMIPFGGYVKMAGETIDGEESLPTGQELTSKSIPQRFLVIVAGSLMNVVVAILFTFILGLVGMYEPTYKDAVPTIGWVMPDSPAAQSDLRKGDTIRAVDGQPVTTWESALRALFLNPDKAMTVGIERGNETLDLTFKPGDPTSGEFPLGGIAMPSPIIVGSARAGYPAEKSGLMKDDRILRANGIDLGAIEEFQAIVKKSETEPIRLEIVRHSDHLEMEIAPLFDESAQTYLIGITFMTDRKLVQYGVGSALRMSLVHNYETAKSMYQLLGQLIMRKASVKNLGGPLMIGAMAGEAAKSGYRELMMLTAFISLNLALINLLPIPVLDGGLILFLILEGIRRKPLSDKSQIVIQNVFFYLLICFALLVTYNDIIRLIPFFANQ